MPGKNTKKKKPSAKYQKRIARAVGATRPRSHVVSGDYRRTVPDLLGDVARALQAVECAGIKIRLAHDAVISDFGYVFRLQEDPIVWGARSRDIAPFTLPLSHDGDE